MEAHGAHVVRPVFGPFELEGEAGAVCGVRFCPAPGVGLPDATLTGSAAGGATGAHMELGPDVGS
jgi:hypothetical protein